MNSCLISWIQTMWFPSRFEYHNTCMLNWHATDSTSSTLFLELKRPGKNLCHNII